MLAVAGWTRVQVNTVVTPGEAMDAIHDLEGAHPGFRALHAKGSLYRGTFTAGSVAATLSSAAHLDGRTVPALVRFSNGSGDPTRADNVPHVRGMAVKFTLPDGKTTDISSQTARLFTASTPDGFVDFLRAAKPGLGTPLRLAKYATQNPALVRTLKVNAVAAKIPASYATIEYHALHAFRWSDASGGSRFVRYHWVPEAGEHFISLLAARSKGHDFLNDDLDARLGEAPVRFTLQVQVAGPDDSTVDPSVAWASEERVTVGTLEIVGLETEREHDGDVVVFDPMRVTAGIEPSDDPILHFRSLAYSESVQLRSGIGRGPDAPN